MEQSAENTKRLLTVLERIATALETLAKASDASIGDDVRPPLPPRNVSAMPPPPPKPNTSNVVPKCPKCGDSMTLKKRKADGGQFWGCVGWPNCRGVVGIDAFKNDGGQAELPTRSKADEDDIPF